MKKILAIAFWCCLPVLCKAAEINVGALDHLPRADVVLLGEVHDNPVHHENQARAVAALRPAALVFEMLTPDQAGRVDGSSRRDADTLAGVLGWAGTGWPDFALYYPIFAAAPEAVIFGGNLPRDQVRRAVYEGAAPVFGAGADRFGLTVPLPQPEQAAREAEQMAAHCDALPVDMLPGMVAAQRLRDAALARAVLQAIAQTGGLVVVITGNGHARRDWGVPEILRQAAPDLQLFSLGQYEDAAPFAPPNDVYLVTKGVARPDPCLAFQKG